MPRKPKTDPNQEPARQRQIKFTPSDREEELIKMIAEWWNVSESTIVSRAVHDQLDSYIQQIERGERFLGRQERSGIMTIEKLILKLASGETVTDEDVIEVSGSIDTPSKEQVIEVLLKIRDLSKRRNGNGCTTGV